MNPQGDKHHYIPKFYLRQWTGPDGLVCEFSKPFKTVKPKRVHPDGTGYERGLYTFCNLSPQVTDFIEKKLLQMADDAADRVLRRMLVDDMDFDADARSAWSRFIMSMMHRNPERILQIRKMIVEKYPEYLDGLRDTFEEIKHPDDPRTFVDICNPKVTDLEHVTIRVLASIINSKQVGHYLNNMVWATIRFHKPRFPLLTSDRPVVMTDGIRYSNSHLVLPIAPDQIFIAAANSEELQNIDRACKHHDASKAINDLVARQSRKYVYSQNDAQQRFIANRLGRAIKCSPFE